MKATRDKRSWEKQTLWKLENGWIATEEYSDHYGGFIKKLDSPDGKMWLASNGTPEQGLGAEHYNKVFGVSYYVDLPEFAAPWVNEHRMVSPEHLSKVY